MTAPWVLHVSEQCCAKRKKTRGVKGLYGLLGLLDMLRTFSAILKGFLDVFRDPLGRLKDFLSIFKISQVVLCCQAGIGAYRAYMAT